MRPPVPLSQRARVGRLLSARSTRTAGRPRAHYGAWVDVWARGSDVVNAYLKGAYKYMEP